MTSMPARPHLPVHGHRIARRPGRLCILVCAAVLSWMGGTACSEDGTNPTTEELAKAEMRWKSTGFTFYAITQTHGCFCVLGGVPVQLIVRGDSVVSAYNTRDSIELPAEQRQYYLSVPRLFAQIHDAQARHAATLDMRFDATYGYPTHVYIDYSTQIADDEISYDNSAFQPLR
jgi:hypothetical protein